MEPGTYKVLVLGAGASMNYGYPSGAELRQQILSLEPKLAENLEIIARGASQKLKSFIEFQEAFRYSQLFSIDAFLGRRPKDCLTAAHAQNL
ncbi:MAG: hypothetical protein ABW178_02835 [Pseudoxanthomonas sp.]